MQLLKKLAPITGAPTRIHPEKTKTNWNKWVVYEAISSKEYIEYIATLTGDEAKIMKFHQSRYIDLNKGSHFPSKKLPTLRWKTRV